MTKEEYDKLQVMLVEEWKGYDLDELKYRRAIALARKEIQKEKILGQVQQFTSMGFSPKNAGSSFVKSIIGNVTVTDYVIIGFKIAKSISKLVKYWRR